MQRLERGKSKQNNTGWIYESEEMGWKMMDNDEINKKLSKYNLRAQKTKMVGNTWEAF